MKVLGKRANMCLFIYPLLFIACAVIAWYFGSLLVNYWTALANDDMETVELLGELIDRYTVRRSLRRVGVMLNPLGYVIYAVFGGSYCIYAFNRRITQPTNLIECDDKGFYLNLPFNKTWYVLYEEVLFIHIIKNEDMMRIPRWVFRRRSYMRELNDPSGYINVTGSTFGILKTGTIVVGLSDRDIKVRGVKNAFEVAKQMKVICNDGKRKRNEWLDEKKREQELKELQRREQELRERTKT